MLGRRRLRGALRCRSSLPLLRQRHLELDLRDLLRHHADLAQERQPARVGMDLGEQVLRRDFGQAGSLNSTVLVMLAVQRDGAEPSVRWRVVGVDCERQSESDSPPTSYPGRRAETISPITGALSSVRMFASDCSIASNPAAVSAA